MAEWLVEVCGAMVIVSGAIAVTGLALGFACDFAWRKLCDAYSLAEVIRVVRKYGKKPEVNRV